MYQTLIWVLNKNRTLINKLRTLINKIRTLINKIRTSINWVNAPFINELQVQDKTSIHTKFDVNNSVTRTMTL